MNLFVKGWGDNMDNIDSKLLQNLTNLHSVPQGSFSIRKNGECISKNSTKEIEISSKKEQNGIDIVVKSGTKNKSVHIPVIITVGGLNDLVYNDFYIGEDSDILIVAGCGIHNPDGNESRHDGIHTFHLAKNCRVKYIEKHLGEGKGGKILNPTTKIVMESGSYFEMETIQLGGVTYSKRYTDAVLKENSSLVVKEKILTTNNDFAETTFNVSLDGKNSNVQVASRGVAKQNSNQIFNSNVIGKSLCFGHIECDGIILDNAKMISIPKIDVQCKDATLIHEAAIGKIAGEQIVKLMSLGLTKEESEDVIIKGYLN